MDPLNLPIARPGRLLTPVIVYDGHDAPDVPHNAGYGYLYKKEDDPALYWTTAEYGEVQVSMGYGFGNIGGPQSATQGGIAMFADQTGDTLVSSQLSVDQDGRLTIAGHHIFGATEHGTIVGREAGGTDLRENYAENTILGYRAAHLLGSAAKNVVVGQEAAYSMATGQKNTILGYQAGLGCSASFNTLVGAQARGTSTAVQSATAIGHDSQASWQAIALGAKATAEPGGIAIGYQAQAEQNTAHIAAQRFRTGIPSEVASRTVYLAEQGHLVCDPLVEDIDQCTEYSADAAITAINTLQVLRGIHAGTPLLTFAGQPRHADILAQCVAAIQHILATMNSQISI